MSPPPTGFEPPRLLPSHNQAFRVQEEARLKQLGVSTQETVKNFKVADVVKPAKKATHKDYDFSRYFTKKQGLETSPNPTQKRQNVKSTVNQQQKLTTLSLNQRITTATTQRSSTVRQTVVTNRPPATTTRKTTRVSTTARSTTTSSKPKALLINKVPASVLAQKVSKIPALELNLLPPFDETKNYDDISTKGPAVYYEWKIPDSGLLPPKFDNETDDVQSKRSITEEGNFGENNDFQLSESRSSTNKNSIKTQYKDLQKLFAIPDVQLPLESSGRDGYDRAEAVNSFQVKIPYKKGETERYYYLEHGHCNPECHPYFFKPGRCEPCIKL